MRCIKKPKRDGKQTIKRVVALACLLCFIIAALLSEVFILSHAGHDHDREGINGSCMTCAQIMQNAEYLLRQLSTTVGGVMFALVKLLIAIAVLYAGLDLTQGKSPVELNTRMNR